MYMVSTYLIRKRFKPIQSSSANNPQVALKISRERTLTFTTRYMEERVSPSPSINLTMRLCTVQIQTREPPSMAFMKTPRIKVYYLVESWTTS
jgi:hypothetical protein